MPFIVRKPKAPGYTTGYGFLDNLLGLNQQEPDVLSLVNPMGMAAKGAVGALGAIYQRLPGKVKQFFVAPAEAVPSLPVYKMQAAIRNLKTDDIIAANPVRPGASYQEGAYFHDDIRKMIPEGTPMEEGFVDPTTGFFYSRSLAEKLERR